MLRLLRLRCGEPIADGVDDVGVGDAAAVAAAASVAARGVHSCCCCCAAVDDDAAALDHLHRGVEGVRRGRRGGVGRGRVVVRRVRRVIGRRRQEARGVGGGGGGGGGHAARHVAHWSPATSRWLLRPSHWQILTWAPCPA